ncbi:CHAP domain-containing protein [Hydrogenoanaerobacterium saccharovorans]|uniref:CHAP domain-containing protein n=1 Tax=Hydrogenoanaerobacterium saccharovorans TaxID=474960 RepID=A0A1H8E4Q3_9FIRM|nr:CHAP domain-containing protein [Hydrogenoanaerobacterium saccharovorans]RPF42120.1 CHAP domain-containing protein [Hydrogenoanaerobacterium saccharovorans]SEN14094.1 CHAP domain-containing protein [Hydrogenoanaerobacterium saccharovorans]
MQCVRYVNKYFGSNVIGNGCDWYNSSATTQVSLQSGCVACWSGGVQGYGHVGVVESWDGSKMTYSDANYRGDGEVITRKNITEDEMLDLFGSSYEFQGYVIPD